MTIYFATFATDNSWYTWLYICYVATDNSWCAWLYIRFVATFDTCRHVTCPYICYVCKFNINMSSRVKDGVPTVKYPKGRRGKGEVHRPAPSLRCRPQQKHVYETFFCWGLHRRLATTQSIGLPFKSIRNKKLLIINCFEKISANRNCPSWGCRLAHWNTIGWFANKNCTTTTKKKA